MAPQTVRDSQSAKLLFDGKTIGVLVGVSPAYQVGNVHEVTDHQSPVIGDGPAARVLKQYNVTSIEPGTIQARFVGSPELTRDDIGRPGVLSFTWAGGGKLSGKAFATALDAEFKVGELIQWSATFQFSGF